MTTETLYTLKDACEELGVYYRLLRHLMAVNRIAARRVGNQLLLSQKEINALRPIVKAWKERPRVCAPANATD